MEEVCQRSRVGRSTILIPHQFASCMWESWCLSDGAFMVVVNDGGHYCHLWVWLLLLRTACSGRFTLGPTDVVARRKLSFIIRKYGLLVTLTVY